MKNFGYTQSNSDHIIFVKRDGRRLTALIVYVDDIVETENDTGEQLKLQKYLSQEFEMKDLGYLKYFLGIEVARSKNGIFLSQMKYVMDLLTETGMLECKLADTPVDITYAVNVVSQFMHPPSVFHRNAVDQILRYLKSTPRK
ncbi:uncharacterized mitochondrial protein AtMg00810-like [Prunus dulcis]|uniref:uncharacterized mitochondrial protein AtMg00810-like n=1 Tax=Prunus dulcis TaxID=3755 RepID=UPI001483994A|nr:uncharacterized mitochondrial protein AtMg00810-like [Prunus dulcis]